MKSRFGALCKIASATVVLVLLASNALASSLLVYDSGDSLLTGLLSAKGYSYDLRSAMNPVTPADLASHRALVIGWSQYAPSGLSQSALASGITGNVLLTGS